MSVIRIYEAIKVQYVEGSIEERNKISFEIRLAKALKTGGKSELEDLDCKWR